MRNQTSTGVICEPGSKIRGGCCVNQTYNGSRRRSPLGHLPPQQRLAHVTGNAVNPLAVTLSLHLHIRHSPVPWDQSKQNSPGRGSSPLDTNWMRIVLRLAFYYYSGAGQPSYFFRYNNYFGQALLRPESHSISESHSFPHSFNNY